VGTRLVEPLGLGVDDREIHVSEPGAAPSVLLEDGDRFLVRISERVGRYLERQGLLVRDMENNYLILEPPDEAAMDNLVGYSITYRVAVGPH